MVFRTPFVKASGGPEVPPDLPRSPAARRLAALIVFDTTAGGTPAKVRFCASRVSITAADTVSPRSASRFPNIARARANQPPTVPSGTPRCRAASRRVLPSRSHRTMTDRYFWGSRPSSSSRTGWRSCHKSRSATTGSSTSVTCLSHSRRLLARALILNAVWRATPYNQLASNSRDAMEAAFRTRTRKVAWKASSTSW
jgi:hypothetical protein